MRKISTPLTAAIALGLLAGSTVGVAGQDEADFAAPSEVTGTFESGECSSPNHLGSGRASVLPGAHTLWTCVGTSSASDSRLAGTSTFLSDDQWFERNGIEMSETLTAGCDEDPDCSTPRVALWHQARSIENDAGTWQQRPFVQTDLTTTDDFDTKPPVHVFDGEGDYDGLIAVLEVSGDDDYDYSDSTHSFYGFILDARQLRPAPDTASTQ